MQEDALFHIYVGLLRIRRGEEAAAFEEIQGKAAQCVLAYLQGDRADAFSSLRHAEQSVSNDTLKQLMPGYGQSGEAAKVMLRLLAEARELPLYRAVGNLLREIALTE